MVVGTTAGATIFAGIDTAVGGAVGDGSSALTGTGSGTGEGIMIISAGRIVLIGIIGDVLLTAGLVATAGFSAAIVTVGVVTVGVVRDGFVVAGGVGADVVAGPLGTGCPPAGPDCEGRAAVVAGALVVAGAGVVVIVGLVVAVGLVVGVAIVVGGVVVPGLVVTELVVTELVVVDAIEVVGLVVAGVVLVGTGMVVLDVGTVIGVPGTGAAATKMSEMLATVVDASVDLKVMVLAPSRTWSSGTGIDMLRHWNAIAPVGQEVSMKGPPLMDIDGMVAANE